MDKICIAYHCSFFREMSRCSMVREPWPKAIPIVVEQWTTLQNSGLAAAASKIIIGINGGRESEAVSKALFPGNAELIFHGIDYKNENGTIDAIHRWAKENPGWVILYFHAKGLTKPVTDVLANKWRTTMMRDVVVNWQLCLAELAAGHDIVCSHWKWNQADGTQHIPAGNFLWVKSDFVAK